jgi:spermidine synthase
MSARDWFLDAEERHRRIQHRIHREVLRHRTAHQEVRILETRHLGKLLVLDGCIQSAAGDEFIYHEALVHPPLLAHRLPRRVLVLGGGEGATLREVLKHDTVQEAVMVDIDGELVDLCRRYLPEFSAGAFSDPRTLLVVDDAAVFLERDRDPFDVIIADLSDPVERGPAAGLYTRGFYSLVKARLKTDGIFVTQALEFLDGSDGRHAHLNRTLASVFATCESYGEYVPSFGDFWMFALGSESRSAKAMAPSRIACRLAERVGGPLRFYDPETHVRLFHLPKMVRQAIQREKSIAPQGNPL